VATLRTGAAITGSASVQGAAGAFTAYDRAAGVNTTAFYRNGTLAIMADTTGGTTTTPFVWDSTTGIFAHPAWTALPVDPNWVTSGAGYRKEVGTGIVRLRGGIGGSATAAQGQVFWSIPVGYRPGVYGYWIVPALNGPGTWGWALVYTNQAQLIMQLLFNGIVPNASLSVFLDTIQWATT
jgi:hypothetical protein